MAYGSLLSDGEIPKINGVKVKAIYGQMETAYRNDQLLSDAYNEKPDYYLIVTEDRKYKDGKYVDCKNIKTRELPPEFAQFFGPQKINGTEVYVTRMYIRNRCSGNGSFIDQTLDFSGGFGATTKTICYYRLDRWPDASKLGIFKGEPLGEKIEKTLVRKSFEVIPLPDDFDVEQPCVYIRNVGGLNYPDTKVSGWRWLYGDSPYVRNAYDPKHIRVYSEKDNAHIYLEEVEPQKGDIDLVKINFNREFCDSFMGQKGDYFCSIVRWVKDKKEAPNQIIRFNVLNVEKDQYGTFVKVAAIANDKVQFKQEMNSKGFYRILKIQSL